MRFFQWIRDLCLKPNDKAADCNPAVGGLIPPKHSRDEREPLAASEVDEWDYYKEGADDTKILSGQNQQ